MSVTTKLFVLRATYAVRRAEHKRRRKLERELAAFSSPSDRLEIEAIIERYPPGQTTELRDILARQSAAALLRPRGFGRSPAA